MDFSEYRKGHYEIINSYNDEQRKELLDEISREKEYNPEDYRRWLRNVAKSIEYKYNVKMLCSTQIFAYMLRHNLNDEEAYDLIKKEFEQNYATHSPSKSI